MCHGLLFCFQTREIIGRVYDFMKKEALTDYAEKLTDARWRTAQATGVSESTVTRILRERRVHAKESEEKESSASQNNTETINTNPEHCMEPFIEIQEDERRMMGTNEAATPNSIQEEISTHPTKKRKLQVEDAFSDSE